MCSELLELERVKNRWFEFRRAWGTRWRSNAVGLFSGEGSGTLSALLRHPGCRGHEAGVAMWCVPHNTRVGGLFCCNA